MPLQTVHVLIADDHDGVRRGIRNIIDTSPQFELVGEAKNGKEALRLTESLAPDILILDVKMPGLSGQEVADAIQHAKLDTKIIALSSYDNAEYILGMFDSGVQGYLTKDEAPSLLLRALGDILRGAERWMSASLIKKTGITPQVRRGGEVSLTHREFEIMHLLKQGYSEEQIAEQLGIGLQRTQKFLRVLIAKKRVSSIDELRDS